MGLVDYASDSESESGQTQTPRTLPASSSKTAFQKVVDPTGSAKIRVNISAPTISQEAPLEHVQPQAKRQRTGGLSGLNALLPPPKRTGVVGNASRGLGDRMGAGVNLRTGSEPGFSRSNEDSSLQSPSSGGLNLPPPRTAVESTPIPAAEVKLVGKATMFKPLSVARNTKKKKPASNMSAKNTATSSSTNTEITKQAPEPIPAPQRPKVSLFSVPTEPEEEPSRSTTTAGPYQPLIYGIQPDLDEETENSSMVQEHLPTESYRPTQSLEQIATDLNLSASDRRQLFGRAGKSSSASLAPSAQTILNFNMDTEYLHNEAVRASGETVSHNPVRSINPGKHSLKQLVEIASSNKEALEESFAKGRNNRNEAAGRYGW